MLFGMIRHDERERERRKKKRVGQFQGYRIIESRPKKEEEEKT